MNKTYLLIDGMNLFFRGANSVSKSASVDSKIGMALHVILNGIRKANTDFNFDHAVMCLEGKSFRKNLYPAYKLNKSLTRLKKTDSELEDDALMMEAFDEFCTFLDSETNMSVVRCPVAEADDVIALFTQMHPDDKCVIMSTDQDYYQLISKNVSIYNGVEKFTVTHEGFFNEYGKPMTTKDTGVIRAPVDPEYCLFLKCIRGDTSDNIFSAYPGVRENGTKNKIGIREAFEDRNAQGYKWVNFMLQRWADKDEVEHYVKDRYEFNRKLIDLREQPDDIKLKCIDAILTATSRPPVQAAGLSFLRFCKTWNLLKIGNDAELYMAAINKRYNT